MIRVYLLRSFLVGAFALVALAATSSFAAPASAAAVPHPQAQVLQQASLPCARNLPHLFHTTQWYLHRLTQTGCTAAAGSPDPTLDPLVYNGGPIMQSIKAYTIFWDPDAGIPTKAIPQTYMDLINRYFADIGRTNMYNINTQYSQTYPSAAFVGSNSGLGGTWHDLTNAYSCDPACSGPTNLQALTDSDIENEVARAIAANHWPNGGLNVEFFVFTEKGVESCYNSQICTPGIPTGAVYGGYCAYHFFYGADPNPPVMYANMPYDPTWDDNLLTCSLLLPTDTTPNNHDADEEISTTSHEHFETVTDPTVNAWYDASGYEIGDKCAYRYGTVASDGGNVTLNGHRYYMQQEWSNADIQSGVAYSGCVLNYAVNTGVKVNGPSTYKLKTNITYTLTAHNAGPEAAHGVMLHDKVPANTTFVSLTQNTGAKFTCATPAAGGTGTVSCSINTLTNGGTATFTMVMHVLGSTPAGAAITDTATLTESATDSNAADNSSTVTSMQSR